MSEPDRKSRDCSPEPNKASTLENDAVASCKALNLDCQSDNKPNNGSMDVCEAEWSSDGSDGSDSSLDSRFVEFDFDATRPKPLGSPDGQCEHCKTREASFLCFFCGIGEFCSPACCELNMEKGKHKCVSNEITTAQNLIDAINQGFLPRDRQTLDDYYLTPLVASDDDEDLKMLIGIYRNLGAKFYISTPQLHQWKQAKQVFNNIVRLHNRYPKRAPAIHGVWLKNHSHVFLEEDKSEVVDLDAYL